MNAVILSDDSARLSDRHTKLAIADMRSSYVFSVIHISGDSCF